MHWTEAEYEAYLLRQGRPPAVPDAAPESALLAAVRRVATAHGYLPYHTHDSRKSARGFPDVCLVRVATPTRVGRLIFAELKSHQGKLTQEQALWLDLLRHSVPGIEAYCWRPSDMPEVVHLLARKERPDAPEPA